MLVDKHPVGIILLSNTVKGIRFSVNKIHWRGCLAREPYARLPEQVIGEIAGWIGAKTNGKITVDWVTDGRQSDENLPVLLKRANHVTLLPYENGKTAPVAKGAAAKRKYAVAIKDGPYAPTDGGAAGAEGLEQVKVDACCTCCATEDSAAVPICTHMRTRSSDAWPKLWPRHPALSKACHPLRHTPCCDGLKMKLPDELGCPWARRGQTLRLMIDTHVCKCETALLPYTLIATLGRFPRFQCCCFIVVVCAD